MAKRRLPLGVKLLLIAIISVAAVGLVLRFHPAFEDWWIDDTCVAAGTLIRTPSGETPVELLRVGDGIVSVDPQTGAFVATRVAAIRTARRHCLRLRTASGADLIVTETHPLFVPELETYLPAGCWLQSNAPLLGVVRNGLVAESVVASTRLSGRRVVYDISVDSLHHNFIAGGILVHNKTPAD